MTVLAERIHVHYGFVRVHAQVADPPDQHLAVRGQANGILGGGVSGALAMVTGLHTGEVEFTVTWDENEPEVESEWEDVVEVSVEVPEATMILSAFEDWVLLDLPAGWHRARYCAVGMDQGSEIPAASLGPDRYALQLWPADPAPERIIRTRSECGAYWHDVAQRQ